MSISGHGAKARILTGSVLFLALLAVYHVNGDFAVGNDSAGNLHLPISLLKEGDFSFTPQEFPFMFQWRLHENDTVRRVLIDEWSGTIDGREVGELYADGKLQVHEPNYYLIPSSREGHYLNAYGIGAGLASLPVFGVVRGSMPFLVEFRNGSIHHAARSAAPLS